MLHFLTEKMEEGKFDLENTDMINLVSLLNFFRLTLSTTNYPTELIEKLLINILGGKAKNQFNKIQAK